MDDFITLAQNAVRENKFQDALGFLEDKVRSGSNDTEALVLYASIFTKLKDWENAFSAWNVVNLIFPERLDGIYEKAQALIELGQMDAASFLFRKIQVEHPNVINGWLGMARVYSVLGDWSNAANCLETMPIVFKSHKHGILYLAEAYLELGNYDKSRLLFQDLLNAGYPYSIVSYQKLLRLFQESKDFRSSVDLSLNFLKFPFISNEKNKRAVIFGESHIGVLSSAYQGFDNGKNGKIFPIDFFKLPNASLFIDDKVTQPYVDLVNKLNEYDTVYLSIGGNEHNVFGLCSHPLAYTSSAADFLSNGTVDKIYINKNLLKKSLRKSMQSFELVCRFLSSLITSNSVDSYGVSSSENRYILWQCRNEIVRELSAEINASYVKNPDEVFDSNGFLRAGLWGDATHGNVQYGNIVINKLIDSEVV
jgi:tetratricopeptide (TPR) repeat protein